MNSLQDIDAAAMLWRDLDKRSTADFVWFQCFEWCRNWVAFLADPKTEPRILMLLHEGRAVAVLPMIRRKTHFGIKLVEILGAPHTQYANVLTELGHLTAAQIKVLQEALTSGVGADTAKFTFVPEGSALSQLLVAHPAQEVLANESAQFHFSKLEDGSVFESTLSKDRQRDLRRCQRLLEAQGPVEYEVLRPGAKAYAETIKIAFAMKHEWLTLTGKVGSSMVQQGHEDFLTSIATSGDGTDGPYVWKMNAGGKPVAIEIGYLQRGHYYAYMGAFDLAARKASPGKLQMSWTLNTLAGAGAESYDLLPNPTDYKKDYATNQMALAGHVVVLTKLGFLYSKLWTQTVDPFLRRAFYALPVSVRRCFATMRKLELKFGV